MSDNIEQPQEEREEFEVSAQQVTGLGGNSQMPVVFKRKRVLIVICVTLAVFVGGGLIANTLKPSRKNSSAAENEFSAGSTSSESFLSSLQNRALTSWRNQANQEAEKEETEPREIPDDPVPVLPEVTFIKTVPATEPPAPPPQSPPPPQNAQTQPVPTHFRSSLVPAVQGNLFSQGLQSYQQGSSQSAAPTGRAANDNNYSAFTANQQNAADNSNKTSERPFYDSSNAGGIVYGGRYLGENSIWTGTIISGILETAINTDLPGNVLARVTQNIYDSQTGRNLLIPQGTLLIARYNSSVSYAQHRVQIVWDTMIRPDGFQLDLDGANGVDRSGMSGLTGKYDEKWFEYLKAAGIITLFSLANAGMTESAAQYASDQSAANLAESNSQFFNKLGGSLIDRAMNIQPTLTVANGTLINIMLNKTLYLPPVENFPTSQKYILQ